MMAMPRETVGHFSALEHVNEAWADCVNDIHNRQIFSQMQDVLMLYAKHQQRGHNRAYLGELISCAQN